MKKTLAMLLAISAMATMGLTACGDKGNGGGTDQGNAKGEQVTAEVWESAIRTTFAADNVTVTAAISYEFEEEGNTYGGTGSGLMKIANDVIYETSTMQETYNSLSAASEYVSYIFKQDGTYYEWYKETVDGVTDEEWTVGECWDAKYYPNFSTTVGGSLLSDWSADALVALFDEFTYNSETGEYSGVVENDYAAGLWTIKVKDGKLYTLTMLFSSEYQDGYMGYDEVKCVFANYGTTSIGALPSEEEPPATSDGSSSESGKTEGAQVTEEEWETAIAAMFAQENIFVAMTQEMSAEMPSLGTMTATAVGTLEYADGKIYTKVTTNSSLGGITTTTVEEQYKGTVDGTVYLWERTNEGAWVCEEKASGSVVDAEDFLVNMVSTMLDGLEYQYTYFVWDEDEGCYRYEMTAASTIELTFADGKLATLLVITDGSTDGTTLQDVTGYVFSYGNASVGELPEVTMGSVTA